LYNRIVRIEVRMSHTQLLSNCQFAVRIVQCDHYMCKPIQIGKAGEFLCEKEKTTWVPVLRIFGLCSNGTKCCVHVHGVFPYFFVQSPEDDPCSKWLSEFKRLLNFQIKNQMQTPATGSGKRTHFSYVRDVSVERLTPFYGYHENAVSFLKISLYNPNYIKKAFRAVKVLQNGLIHGIRFEAHESHVPYTLQFFIDFNLYGMDFLYLRCVKFRKRKVQNEKRALAATNESFDDQDPFLCQSTCEVELDCMADDILNTTITYSGELQNPGLKYIWADEANRRMASSQDSTFSYTPLSQGERKQLIVSEIESLYLKDLDEKIASSKSAPPVQFDSACQDELDEQLMNILRELQSESNDDNNSMAAASCGESLDGRFEFTELSLKSGNYKKDTCEIDDLPLEDEDEEILELEEDRLEMSQSLNDLLGECSDLEFSLQMQSETAGRVEQVDGPPGNGRKKPYCGWISFDDGSDDSNIGSASMANLRTCSSKKKEKRGTTGQGTAKAQSKYCRSSTEGRNVDAECGISSEVKKKKKRKIYRSVVNLKGGGQIEANPNLIATRKEDNLNESNQQANSSRLDPVDTFGCFVKQTSDQLCNEEDREEEEEEEEEEDKRAVEKRHSTWLLESSDICKQQVSSATVEMQDAGNLEESLCVECEEKVSELQGLAYGPYHTLPSEAPDFEAVKLWHSCKSIANVSAVSEQSFVKATPDGDSTCFATSPAACSPTSGRAYSVRQCCGRRSSASSTSVAVLSPAHRSLSDTIEVNESFESTLSTLVADNEQRTPKQHAPLSTVCSSVDEVLKIEFNRKAYQNRESDGRRLSIRRYVDFTPKRRKSSASKSNIFAIEGPSLDNTFAFDITDVNFADVRIAQDLVPLCTMSMELHVCTRDKFRPDPQLDPIVAIFYAVHVNGHDCIDHFGCIVVSEEEAAFRQQLATTIQCCEPDLSICVQTESELLEQFSNIVSNFDPDLIVGYEIQMLSWGYLFERASFLGMDMCTRCSRIPDKNKQSRSSSDDDWWSMANIHVAGRIVLNLWHIMRSVVTLGIYTFENVVFHVLRKRVPFYSFEQLTHWHTTSHSRWRVYDYYKLRVCANLEMLIQRDILNRTSELARLFGIQFFDVLSRGSQFRVESMLLRMTKARQFVSLSPNPFQRRRMEAPECLPLNLEPESQLYHDPVVVLDFQSLYPSICIAYNYCYSTCLGKVKKLRKADLITFGCSTLSVSSALLAKLRPHLNVSPAGVAFVNSDLRRGILPQMLEEILSTRVMVKRCMQQYSTNKPLVKILDSRQLGLKLIANVTYGYTSANFSGRMPCVEVADSIVSKGRETLENAIRYVNRNEKWNARVVYGDTDRFDCEQYCQTICPHFEIVLVDFWKINFCHSKIMLFDVAVRWVDDDCRGSGASQVEPDGNVSGTKLNFSLFVLLRGISKEKAFAVGAEIAASITEMNPYPVKLKFEKVYYPCILQTKKRYVGYSYQSVDQMAPTFDAKGIETVRRDTCPAVSKILEKSLRILFETNDINNVRNYVCEQFQKILSGSVPLMDFIFAKEYRGKAYYRQNASVPSLHIAKRRMIRDHRAEPRIRERVRYLIVCGEPKCTLISCVKEPEEFLLNPGLRLNVIYYIVRQISPALNRCFNILGHDALRWFERMPKRIHYSRLEQRDRWFYGRISVETDRRGQLTLSQYFPVNACPVCKMPTTLSVCSSCREDSLNSCLCLLKEQKHLQRCCSSLIRLCYACSNILHNPAAMVNEGCTSLDCPVYFKRQRCGHLISRIRECGDILDTF
ncbi:DNA polymerase zeta catalytic subunit, partial [Trichinella nelsoni]